MLLELPLESVDLVSLPASFSRGLISLLKECLRLIKVEFVFADVELHDLDLLVMGKPHLPKDVHGVVNFLLSLLLDLLCDRSEILRLIV